GLRAAHSLQCQWPHERQDGHGRGELQSRRRRLRQRQMVGRQRSALPEMDELDGWQILLLQTYPEWRERAVGAQRRPFRDRAHRRLSRWNMREWRSRHFGGSFLLLLRRVKPRPSATTSNISGCRTPA